MSKTQRYVLLGIILIIATFLRFYHFNTTPPGLYPDEAMNGNDAVTTAQTGHFQVFYTNNNGREGLYIDILALTMKALPAFMHEPWIVRLPAAVAGILTVWGLYLLVAELFGNGPGLLASFLLATSFWHINFSRIGFRAILSPLFLVWAIYLLTKAYRSSSKKNAWWYAIIAGILYSLGFYTYIAYRVTPILFLLFIPFFRKLEGFWKRTIIFIITVFIVAAPIGLYFLHNPADFFGRTTEISVTNAPSPGHALLVNIVKTLLMFNFHGDYNWRQNISGAPELFWPVGMLFVLGILLGLYTLWMRMRKKELGENFHDLFPTFGVTLVFAWMVFGSLPEVISNEGIPHALRSILMIPPTMIFATLGALWLYRIIKKYWNANGSRAIAVAFLIIVAGFGYYDYFIAWAGNPNVPGAFAANYAQIGNQINSLPNATPKYVIVSAGGVIAEGWPVPAETVMFITDSFTPQAQSAHNIRYLLPNETNNIPAGTSSSTIFSIN